ncbi:MAG: zf-HC2 domain-containing protein [Acidobacteria bacterium]|nr:zf-HC2 domain-containing protein [Acidobacteriota bacterium]
MTIELQSHPGEDVLERYTLGHLATTEVDRVEEHLFVCEQCQDQLADVERFIAEMKVACHDYRLQPAPKPNWWANLSQFLAAPRMAYAGAMALLVMAFALPLMRQQSSELAPETVTWSGTYRGVEANVADAHAKRPLNLVINIANLPASPAYRVVIVDQDGREVWSGSPVTEGSQLVARIRDSLSAGVYWVRLFTADGEPLREFGLHLS